MKPSPCNRRACEIVKDFLVGLAVFFAVFMLAMLDSRASCAAPAVISKPAVTAQNIALSNQFGKINRVSLQVRRGGGYGLIRVMTEDHETALRPDNETWALNVSMPERAHKKPDNSAKPAAGMSRLALKKAKRRPGVFPVAGAPSTMSRSWMIAVMALFFAAMTAITLSLWRQLRGSVSSKRGRKV
ncbi:MAG: hypothetical protein ACTSP0_10145 [Alphaproteobacteria bacterium]